MSVNSTSIRDRTYPWDSVLCGVVCLIAILVSRPFVEIGLFDDFSYVRTAWDFAHTGHFFYNGWATAMLGWQIVFAAPFVLVFGDTYFGARLSVVVLYVLLVLLLHAVCRRIGLHRSFAVFATLLVGLSPLTLPLAVSFMTDIAGMLVLAACFYCVLRAIQAESERALILWLTASVLVGILGGTARQIAWLGPLVLSPSAAWLLRRSRWVPQIAIAGWLVTVVSILGTLHWFARQPFSVPEPIAAGPFHLGTMRVVVSTEIAAVALLAALLAPAFLTMWTRPAAGTRLLSMKAIAASVLAAACLAGVLFIVTRHGNEHGWFPWTSDIVDRMNVFDGPDLWMRGPTPATLNLRGRMVASCLLLTPLFLFAVALRRLGMCMRSSVANRISLREIATLLGPFSVAYLLLLAPRAMAEHQVLDRYLLPLLMFAAPVVTLIAQECSLGQGSTRAIPAVAWAALAFMSLWSVLSLHDFISGFRARLVAVQAMESAGIPVRAIDAGWEWNGMEQLRLQGYVVDHRVTYPVGADIAMRWPPGMPDICKRLFLYNTPALRQQYFLAFAPRPCLAPSEFAPVPVPRWLPPYDSQYLILKLAY